MAAGRGQKTKNSPTLYWEKTTESRSLSGAEVPGKLRARSEAMPFQVDCSHPSETRNASLREYQMKATSRSMIDPDRPSSVSSNVCGETGCPLTVPVGARLDRDS